MSDPKIDQAELDLIRDIASFRHDPLGYVLYSFRWGEGELTGKTGPRKWQRKYLETLGDLLRKGEITVQEAIQMAIASGHGIGKSALVSWVILWAMSTFEDTKGVVTANTENQLKTKTWAELAKWHRLSINSHWFDFEATSMSYRDPKRKKTWRIDMIPWSLKNTEAFAGLHNEGKRILIIFDEASAIPDAIWEVTEGALTDENTEILWLVFGNPTRNTGRFKSCFGKLKHRWVNEQIDSRDVEGTNKTQHQKWIDDYGVNSDFVKVRVRGMFPNASLKQFISTEDVDKAFGKHLRPEQYNFAPKIISVDPAWEGDDELVISMRQGLHFKVLRTMPKNDNDLVVGAIVAQYEDDEQADAVFVDIGWGSGIISYGRTMKRKWVPVDFGDTSADPGCFNKRAEMWDKARRWLKDGGSLPPDQVLYNDLINPEIVARNDGKIQLESKKDMKARGEPSPGRGDSLALTFAHPVSPKARPRSSPKSAHRTDYKPY